MVAGLRLSATWGYTMHKRIDGSEENGSEDRKRWEVDLGFVAAGGERSLLNYTLIFHAGCLSCGQRMCVGSKEPWRGSGEKTPPFNTRKPRYSSGSFPEDSCAR